MTTNESLTLIIFQTGYDPGWMTALRGRRQAKSVDEMLARIEANCKERLSWMHPNGVKVCEYILSKMGTPRMREYAERVFAECVEMEKILDKGTTGDVVRKGPTEKQVALLNKLGVKVPGTLWEASKLIDQHLGK